LPRARDFDFYNNQETPLSAENTPAPPAIDPSYLRLEAVRLAIQAKGLDDTIDVLTHAAGIYNFVSGASGTTAVAPTESAATKTPKSAKQKTAKEQPKEEPEEKPEEKPETKDELDDLFGDDEPATKDEPETTIDRVRDALVKVQTKFKSKDKAISLLNSVAGSNKLGDLKPEDYGKLVKKATALLAG